MYHHAKWTDHERQVPTAIQYLTAAQIPVNFRRYDNMWFPNVMGQADNSAPRTNLFSTKDTKLKHLNKDY